MDKKAFSLTENITVLAILGVILVLTVPHMVTSNNAKSRRIAVRKAVTNYQSILNKEILTATGINTVNDFNIYLKGSDNSCDRIRNRFQVKTANGCIFITEDGIKWDLTTPSEAFIQLGKDATGTGAINSNNNIASKAYSNADTTVFYIPFSVANRQVRILTQGTTTKLTNNDNRQNAREKTRNFMLGE